jgi:plasmid stabilization system protein ParE
VLEQLPVRFSRRAYDDFARIAAYWQAVAPELTPQVFAALNERIGWLRSSNRHLLGTPLPDVGPRYRVARERRFGYALYYRVDGDPGERLTIVTIRHGRQRPLRAATIARLDRPPPA